MRQDVSGWQTRLSDELIAENTQSGIWRNKTLADLLAAQLARDPDQILIVDGDTPMSARDIDAQARALAGALQQRGLVPGDVISFQLPNWREAVVVDVAASLLGLVCNPIIPIYRDTEVAYILKDAGTKFVFVPTEFRGFDYVAMIERHRAALPDLEHIVTVRGKVTGNITFEGLLDEGADAAFAPSAVDPNAVKLIMYTSGTTGRPKGVLHSHNTIDTENQAFSKFLGLDQHDVILMPSPLTHITGYLYGIQLPIVLGAPVVFMESWNAEAAADLIDRHGVTFTIAATVFLQELTEFARINHRPLPSLRYFPCGGAPVPPEIIYNAHKTFDRCVCARCYGSTEAPTVTLGVNSRDQESLGAATEGLIVGHEVKLVDETGTPVPVGVEGEIITRGPEMCLGYADIAHNDAFDADGYFHTGDLAVLTEDDCLVITGRSKDLIIRGGENLSPREVEDALHEIPAIYEAAVVAMPHPRMGETGCAYVILEQGASLTFDEMIAALAQTGMAKQKYPERLEIVDAFPRTPAGKIRKNVLREQIAAKLAAESQ
ncbi:MAG: AMP-binding protein [Alphaproteobacteria bacterium]|nr:AMP-binding protein [Alphaproteobacteria bacterium]